MIKGHEVKMVAVTEVGSVGALRSGDTLILSYPIIPHVIAPTPWKEFVLLEGVNVTELRWTRLPPSLILSFPLDLTCTPQERLFYAAALI